MWQQSFCRKLAKVLATDYYRAEVDSLSGSISAEQYSARLQELAKRHEQLVAMSREEEPF